MPRALRVCLFLAIGGACVAPVQAHFNMLLPHSAYAKAREPVNFVYQWGHPFEHELFDAPAPESVFVLSPEGKKTTLTGSLTKSKTPGEKGVAIHRFAFTPQERGDHVFLLNTPPIWMEEERHYLQDSVKVVLHVQTQNGWDQAAGLPIEMVPLTRPYGLRSGMVFQAQALVEGKPLAGALVEIEPYHAAPPKTLPADEHRTLTAKTDPNGVVTCTLTEPGWWCLTAQRKAGQKDHDGKAAALWQRATLWVFVDDKP